MKLKLMKVPRKTSATKNLNLHIEERCAKVNCITRFFFSQTYFLSSTWCWLAYWIIFNSIHSPFTFWLTFDHRSWGLSSVSTFFLYRPVKFWWGSVLLLLLLFFLKIFSFKMYSLCSYLLIGKITPDITILSNFYIPCKSWAIICVLDAVFGVWLM